MQKEVSRLLNMFLSAAHGKTWHGQSIWKIVQDISAEEAASHPIADSHSIWDYLIHMINWRDYAIRTILEDEPYIVELNTEKDWTTITDFSPEAWQKALELYESSTEELAEAIKTLDDSKLEEVIPEHKYTFYTMLHGVIQHDIYHSGQIVLLKKLIRK